MMLNKLLTFLTPSVIFALQFIDDTLMLTVTRINSKKAVFLLIL